MRRIVLQMYLECDDGANHYVVVSGERLITAGKFGDVPRDRIPLEEWRAVVRAVLAASGEC